MKECAVDFICTLVLFILLHEGDEWLAVRTFALRFAVVMQHDLRQLLQRFTRTTESGDAQVQLGNHAVYHRIAVRDN